MARMERQARGRISPYENGQGSEFVIPPDMMPDGLTSGDSYRCILDGNLNVDKETGQGIIYVNKFRVEKTKWEREDSMQEKAEKEMDKVMHSGM